MTKKEFKEICNCQVYTGRGRNFIQIKINALYFDFKQGTNKDRYFGGYKYRISANVKDMPKAELFNLAYELWTGKKSIKYDLPWYVDCKNAETDDQRFKIQLSL